MKKTIIALLALAGVATAETVVFDFGRTDDAAYKTSNAIVIGTGNRAYSTNLTSSDDLGAIYNGSIYL